MEYETKRTIHHHMQLYVQPLCYIGVGLYLGRKYNALTPALLSGVVGGLMVFGARRVWLMCITGKVLVLGAKNLLVYKTCQSLKNRGVFLPAQQIYRQAAVEITIGVIFTFLDILYSTYVYAHQHGEVPLISRCLQRELIYLGAHCFKDEMCQSYEILMTLIDTNKFYPERKQTLQKGVENLKKIADQGNLFACYQLSQIYIEGLYGAEKDREKGLAYLKIVADQEGSQPPYVYKAAYLLGHHYKNDNKEDSLIYRYMKKAMQHPKKDSDWFREAKECIAKIERDGNLKSFSDHS